MPASSDLIPRAGGEVARSEPTMLEMIHQSIIGGDVPAEKLPQVLSAFFDFQLRVQAVDAEKEFNREFSAAMMEMPRVAKRGKKDMTRRGEERGSGGVIAYATYDDVDAAIRPIEGRHGFARTFSTRITDKGYVMVLRLTHSAGHSITSERPCRPDPGPGRNDIQAEGSGESYSRRYLTLAVWNIVTGGADDDANSADPITQTQAMDVHQWLDLLALEPPKLAKFWAWIGPPAVSPETIQKQQYDKVATYLKGLIRGAK